MRTTTATLCATLIAVSSGAFPNPWEALPPPVDDAGVCVEGPLGDATCDAAAVDRANSEQLHSILQELTNTTFFRIWRVDLHRECPFDRFADADTAGSCAPVDPMPPPIAFGAAASGSSPLSGGAPSSRCAVSDGGVDHADGFVTDVVDTTISFAEGEAAGTDVQSAACDDEELPQFWLDMCARIPTSAGEPVNLKLNPESDTGFNGSHIWEAIYEENCFVRASQPNAMCLEERVLYRVLSGMHASTNIHAAMHHNASHSLHASAEAIFAKHFTAEGDDERLRNLHFAFVVLLRAVQKASSFLQSYDYERLGLADAERTRALVERLLESCILQSCSSVFSAFDEGRLFQPSQQPHVHTWWSLKRQFKGVFHNISSILDCVSCQKCRLHGKLQLLGVGTALKWLLLPPDLIATATSREELVALINTLSKFSRSIAWTRKLKVSLTRAQAAGLVEHVRNSMLDTAEAIGAPAMGAARGGAGGGGGAAAADVAARGGADPALVDRTVSLIASAAAQGEIDSAVEHVLLQLVAAADPVLFSVVRHYGDGARRHLPLLAHSTTTLRTASGPGSPAAAANR